MGDGGRADMSSASATVALLGALASTLAGGAGGLAAPGARSTGASVTISVWAVRGTVKSVGPHRLVLTHPCRAGGDLTFVLTDATSREGIPTAGAVVSVRYRLEGSARVATAVAVRPPPTSGWATGRPCRP